MASAHIAARNRDAVDFEMPEGTPVVAARRGVVAGTESRFGASRDEEPVTHDGNFVLVRHADGTLATYAHLRHRGVAVARGDPVEEGGFLGYSGATGEAPRPQLHFGVSRLEGEAGARYEVSVPVRFYIGSPPLAFAPRPWLVVTANYSSPAETPRTESERLAWQSPSLPPEEMPKAWLTLAALALALVGGIAWYWRFSRD